MLKKIYLSPLGYVISFILNTLSLLQQPFMVYGFYNRVQKKFMKYTRVGSSVKIISKKDFDISDYVWIGHYSLLDASNGIELGAGVQTGPCVSIFTHSSHIAIRLLGKDYLEHNDRIGYINGKVTIGNYTFIGTSSIIFPDVTIGKGCLIKAGTIVTKSIPDFSIVSGNPAVVIGSTLDIDEKYFKDERVQKHYFDRKKIEEYIRSQD